jgi:hypothetical protein
VSDGGADQLGQRTLAPEPNRDSRECLVDSGYLAMAILARYGGSRRVLPHVPGAVRQSR